MMAQAISWIAAVIGAVSISLTLALTGGPLSAAASLIFMAMLVYWGYYQGRRSRDSHR